MLVVGVNLNANNRQPVKRAHAEGIARGQPADRLRNLAPRIQHDSEDDSKERDDMGYGLAPPAKRLREQDDYRLKANLPSKNNTNNNKQASSIFLQNHIDPKVPPCKQAKRAIPSNRPVEDAAEVVFSTMLLLWFVCSKEPFLLYKPLLSCHVLDVLVGS
ncbi:hypothetical protein SADUNF_Sadunf16G0084900 [Salix dunnii]|uniref:Uncharacterized protein n=1 Tax=Salix dunnii TaxID=1413687 RepID=A0A835JD57_9ROSI|nr:hypothetical protein SADUNF_Sadunf16G0084900 [Salix dunnii]